MAEEKIESRIKIWLENIVLATTAILFIGLIFNPKMLNQWCEKGGFNECIFFGAKYAPTQQQQNIVQNTEQSLGEIQSQLKAAIPEIKAAAENSNNEKLSKNLEKLELLAAKAENAVSTLSPVVSELAPEGRWAIVFGGDTTHKLAVEVSNKAQEKINQRNYGIAKIVFRQNYYRNIIVFSSREEAKVKFDFINELSYHKDAYIVNFNTWCTEEIRMHDEYGEYYKCSNL